MTRGRFERHPRQRPAPTPLTIEYRCHRCLLVAQSKPLPLVVARGPSDPPLLRVYELPEGWALITRPRGEAAWCRCVECQKDVARGAPEVLG